jgi:hypothetical protein
VESTTQPAPDPSAATRHLTPTERLDRALAYVLLMRDLSETALNQPDPRENPVSGCEPPPPSMA